MNLREAKEVLIEHGYRINKLNECSAYMSAAECGALKRAAGWKPDADWKPDAGWKPGADLSDIGNLNLSDEEYEAMVRIEDKNARKAYNNYIKDKKPDAKKLKNLIYDLLVDMVPEDNLKIQANYQTSNPTATAYIKCNSGTNLILNFNKNAVVTSMRYGKTTNTEELEKLFIYGDDKLIKNIINHIGIKE